MRSSLLRSHNFPEREECQKCLSTSLLRRVACCGQRCFGDAKGQNNRSSNNTLSPALRKEQGSAVLRMIFCAKTQRWGPDTVGLGKAEVT